MQARVGLLVSDVMPIYMIIPRYSHNYAQFCQLLISNSFTHRKILMLLREATSETYGPGREGERAPFSIFFLDLLPRWEKGFPSGSWSPWHGRGESSPKIGYVSLSLSVSAFQILAFHRFLYSRRSITPIGLKFEHDFYPDISFLAAKEGQQPPYGVSTRVRGAPLPRGPLEHRLALISLPKIHIYSKKNLRQFLSHLDSI